MRYMRLAIFLFALSGCNSAQRAKDVANQEYALGSYEQSLEAYQLCAEQNAKDPQKCSALARVIDADRKRFEKISPGS
jgi:hypothetical protein